MTQYSVQPGDRIFVKGYGFLSFAKNMGKDTRKNLTSKYSSKILSHAKQCATDSLKTVSKRATQKTGETIGDLIGNKIADKITRVSKTSPKNNSETNEQEILRGIYIYIPRIKTKIFWWLKVKGKKIKEESYWCNNGLWKTNNRLVKKYTKSAN